MKFLSVLFLLLIFANTPEVFSSQRGPYRDSCTRHLTPIEKIESLLDSVNFRFPHGARLLSGYLANIGIEHYATYSKWLPPIPNISHIQLKDFPGVASIWVTDGEQISEYQFGQMIPEYDLEVRFTDHGLRDRTRTTKFVHYAFGARPIIYYLEISYSDFMTLVSAWYEGKLQQERSGKTETDIQIQITAKAVFDLYL